MNSQALLVGLAILSTSFWGSWHCAAMCGPVACLMANKKSLWTYHLGRGFSYTGLGFAGGYLGSFFLASDLQIIRLISGVAFALILIVIGFQTFRGQQSIYRFRWVSTLYTPQRTGLTLGLLSMFLPCGWLYSYVLAAAATQSAYAGAAVLFLFWLGGLPALSSFPLLIGKAVQVAPEKKRKIASAVLVFAGLYSLVSFYFMHSF